MAQHGDGDRFAYTVETADRLNCRLGDRLPDSDAGVRVGEASPGLVARQEGGLDARRFRSASRTRAGRAALALRQAQGERSCTGALLTRAAHPELVEGLARDRSKSSRYPARPRPSCRRRDSRHRHGGSRPSRPLARSDSRYSPAPPTSSIVTLRRSGALYSFHFMM